MMAAMIAMMTGGSDEEGQRGEDLDGDPLMSGFPFAPDVTGAELPWKNLINLTSFTPAHTSSGDSSTGRLLDFFESSPRLSQEDGHHWWRSFFPLVRLVRPLRPGARGEWPRIGFQKHLRHRRNLRHHASPHVSPHVPLWPPIFRAPKVELDCVGDRFLVIQTTGPASSVRIETRRPRSKRQAPPRQRTRRAASTPTRGAGTVDPPPLP